ncbi:hypothetical protein BTJ39_23860 [Izhakiella australiensis]|uniref:Uncharacterized protein n=1 Tax=Izhakiella australiensis TaxID=1926881 RepID=A0A1S8Y6Z4_9GAMM|nr:hypothetical protein [Izhakiella australiensis]OON34632.1 hypothetical protein BTJ39_23860 [Izhakiella australiensis]
MEIKLVKYWKVELFGQQPESVITQMLAEKRKPFFTGYSKEQVNPQKLHGSEFISLAPSPDSLELQAIRLYRVGEIKCSPVYEQEADSFAEAAEPLIKWMAENTHPHHSAIVTSTGAELLMSERVHNTDK